MSFLLDTNVISELVRPKPNAGVCGWMTTATDCYISALTIGELEKGIELADDPIRKRRLEDWLHKKILKEFAARTLSVDLNVARLWGTRQARLQRSGLKLPAVDGLLAATAELHRLTLVTRNDSDFLAAGISLLNPWT